MADSLTIQTESVEVAKIAVAYEMARTLAMSWKYSDLNAMEARLHELYQKAKKVVDEA